jgi:hypothetical protein
MNRRNIINVPASIRDKLLNKSREIKRPFVELLQYYSIERFLYRLSISDHAHKFFLKGALMFRAWRASDHRATMDIDLLGKTTNSVQNLESICREICRQDVPLDDGISFFANAVRGKVVQSEAEYEGIRIEFEGGLDKAIISMQIDIGFGDIITPGPQLLSYPTILGLPPPQLHGYTVESVIAEKLEIMIKRGITNSRMKDFFDIWTLSKQFSFGSISLASAIQATFNRRGTPIHASPECFSKAFASDTIKNIQWKSFIHKNQLGLAPDTLAVVVDHIGQFLSPILQGLNRDNLVNLQWTPSQKWSKACWNDTLAAQSSRSV